MHNAHQAPFSRGKYPVRQEQLDAFVRLVASVAAKYGIPITRKTVLMHSEVQQTLGITQRCKWDLNWLPGMNGPADPHEVGDILRDLIRKQTPYVLGDSQPGRGSPRPVLDRGDRGPQVVELQTLLGITADGHFGPKTERAVKAHQRERKLTADGIVGKRTWATLLEG